jgi:proline dehydrogenase
MFDRASRLAFQLLAGSRVLNRAASRVGMRSSTSFVRRFVPGDTVEDAVAAGRALEARGLTATFDHLGEHVSSVAAATAATDDYLSMGRTLVEAGVTRNMSVKLTQLGVDVDRATAVDNLRKLLAWSEPAGFFVRIDMESSRYTALTIEIFETLWQQGYRQVGVVLQSDLRRSEQDLARMNAIGARVRLVKGAYLEPRSVAYQSKAEVDAAYVRMMKALLTDGTYPALATHDPAMIALARSWAADHAIASDRFEFQMLYGIRRDLQTSLVQEGYRVRVYVPFGREWFPYFMRRLGERPANVAFVLRGIASDRGWQ